MVILVTTQYWFDINILLFSKLKIHTLPDLNVLGIHVLWGLH